MIIFAIVNLKEILKKRKNICGSVRQYVRGVMLIRYGDLSHPVLGPRLKECTEAALSVEGRSAFDIFGSPDEMKLKSCATLFAFLLSAGSVFEHLIDKYFQGECDQNTLRLL